jgi:hypothetical protein
VPTTPRLVAGSELSSCACPAQGRGSLRSSMARREQRWRIHEGSCDRFPSRLHSVSSTPAGFPTWAALQGIVRRGRQAQALDITATRANWVMIPRSGTNLGAVSVTLFAVVPGCRPTRGKRAKFCRKHLQQSQYGAHQSPYLVRDAGVPSTGATDWPAIARR